MIDREVERCISDKYKEDRIRDKETEDKKILLLSLPYFGEFAEDFRVKLNRMVNTSFPKIYI